jgi:hypothetical protein
VSPTTARLLRIASVIAVALAVSWGLVLIVVAATLGHCSAFGGRSAAHG